MEGFLVKLPGLLEQFCSILGSIVVVATVVVRITPSKKDDELVGKFGGFVYKLLSYAPTLGVNPQTKKLQAAYEALKEEKKPESGV